MDSVIIDNNEYIYDHILDKYIINYDNNIKYDNNNSWYSNNYDLNFWEQILSRKLYYEEKKIIYGVLLEEELNSNIKCLQKNLIKFNCYIKSITNNIGNCLFESLASFGLGDNDLHIQPQVMIRKNIASILLAIKTEIKFFPNVNLTPENLFNNTNEIDMIKDIKTNEIYIYNYDTMILDLSYNFSWKRLPTEFILMTISRIYQVKILIYHNKSNYVNIINVWDGIINDDLIDVIRLGQINEEHYFPVLELSDELKNKPHILFKNINSQIYYKQNITKFNKWSKTMIESLQTNYSTTCNKKENNYNKIIKTKNELTKEQEDDYNQILNLNDFEIL